MVEVDSVELGLVIASMLSINPSNEMGLSRESAAGRGLRAGVGGEISSMATLILELSPNGADGLRSEISTLTVGSNPGVCDGCRVDGNLGVSFLVGL